MEDVRLNFDDLLDNIESTQEPNENEDPLNTEEFQEPEELEESETGSVSFFSSSFFLSGTSTGEISS